MKFIDDLRINEIENRHLNRFTGRNFMLDLDELSTHQSGRRAMACEFTNNKQLLLCDVEARLSCYLTNQFKKQYSSVGQAKHASRHRQTHRFGLSVSASIVLSLLY